MPKKPLMPKNQSKHRSTLIRPLFAVAIAAFLGALVGAKPAVKALAEAAATLWKTWREGRELDRQAIAARLTAQKWRAFVDVPEAR